MDLSRYTFETLRKDEASVLQRGRPFDGSPSILVLSTTTEYPAPDNLKRVEHEHALRAQLDSNWAARPLSLARLRNRPALVLEDVEGAPLSGLLGEPVELARALRFGVGLAGAIEQMHQRGIIHKDIKPANVLVDPSTARCWLTGFGIASQLPRESQPAEPPEFVAGTLAYMAPEQTGRMNRSIDSRSDLYSLGVTLYEMLTGTL